MAYIVMAHIVMAYTVIAYISYSRGLPKVIVLTNGEPSVPLTYQYDAPIVMKMMPDSSPAERRFFPPHLRSMPTANAEDPRRPEGG